MHYLLQTAAILKACVSLGFNARVWICLHYRWIALLYRTKVYASLPDPFLQVSLFEVLFATFGPIFL